MKNSVSNSSKIYLKKMSALLFCSCFVLLTNVTGQLSVGTQYQFKSNTIARYNKSTAKAKNNRTLTFQNFGINNSDQFSTMRLPKHKFDLVNKDASTTKETHTSNYGAEGFMLGAIIGGGIGTIISISSLDSSKFSDVILAPLKIGLGTSLGVVIGGGMGMSIGLAKPKASIHIPLNEESNKKQQTEKLELLEI